MLWYVLLILIFIQCVIGILTKYEIIFKNNIDLAIKIGGIPTVLICEYDVVFDMIKSLFIYYPCRSKNGKEFNMYCTLFDIESNSVPSYIVILPSQMSLVDIFSNRLVHISKVIKNENKKLKR